MYCRPSSFPVCYLSGLLLMAAGCDNFGRAVSPEPAPPPKPPQEDLLRRGTIGAETLVTNAIAQPIRGFGLVIGLDGRGSGDCPTVIRDYLIEFLTKQIGPQGATVRAKLPSPGEMIDSPDTAVVEVTALIAAGSRKGARVDLQVRALGGTSTQSLEGGLLLPTELRYFDRAASGQGLIAGGVLAEGGGPLFVNPFAGDDTLAAPADPRQGVVFGGGRVLDEHPTRLMLVRPNYQLAQSIERRINERFGQRPKVAQAQSVGYVELNTPATFARQPEYFRRLVAQLLLDVRPAVAEERLRELSRTALAGDADLARIALSWEAAGRSALPTVQPLYTHADARPRFYAARTGARLGDVTALPVLGGLAAAGAQELRLLAIDELGRSDSPQASTYLGPLLSGENQDIRVAAYEAILGHSHPGLRSTTFGHVLDSSQINFVLDVIECAGPPLIYVRQSRLARVAVFGSRMAVTPPVFYNHADDAVTIHTVTGADDLRVFTKRRGKLSDELAVPPRVADLITALAERPARDAQQQLRGLGLPYSRVVRIVAALAKQEALPAPLVAEPTTPTAWLGPEVSPDRPETEAKE